MRRRWQASLSARPAGLKAPTTRCSLGHCCQSSCHPCIAPPWGELLSVNLETGITNWRRPLGLLDKLMRMPLPLNWGTPMSGGPIVTDGGLVFIGATADERFRALDVATGEELWVVATPTSSMATPMTYTVDGRQFVVIASAGTPGCMGVVSMITLLPTHYRNSFTQGTNHHGFGAICK